MDPYPDTYPKMFHSI